MAYIASGEWRQHFVIVLNRSIEDRSIEDYAHDEF